MDKEVIPYEQSLTLKELGFDKPCFGYYTGDKKHLVLRPQMGRINEPDSYVITAPLYQQAFRWFREKGFEFYIQHYLHTSVKYYQVYLDYEGGGTVFGKSLSYEEAESACLKKLIEIIQTK